MRFFGIEGRNQENLPPRLEELENFAQKCTDDSTVPSSVFKITLKKQIKLQVTFVLLCFNRVKFSEGKLLP